MVASEMLNELDFTVLMREAAHGNSPVTKVEYLEDADLPHRPIAICISFASGDLYLIARGEDDSLYVANAAPQELQGDVAAKDVSRGDPWRRIIGAKLMWAWLLTNHQGYIDGAPFEFRGESPSDTSCVQIVVSASTLYVRTVLLPGEPGRPSPSCS
jgi:hypothetical protein